VARPGLPGYADARQEDNVRASRYKINTGNPRQRQSASHDLALPAEPKGLLNRERPDNTPTQNGGRDNSLA